MTQFDEHQNSQSRVNAKADLHPLLREKRAVLFDVGGTLVHPQWERLAELAERIAGHKLEPTALRRALVKALHDVDLLVHAGKPLPDETQVPGWLFRRMYIALGVDAERYERLRLEVETAHTERHLWSGLDEDAPRVITALKNYGFKVGVISNTEDGRLAELLELVQLLTHFDLLLDSHVVKERKPESAIFQLAFARLGIRSDEAVYIGDSYGHDIIGAQRVGMPAILLDPLDLYAELDCPRINRLSELINYTSA